MAEPYVHRNPIYVKGTGEFEGNISSPNIDAHLGLGGSTHPVVTQSVAGFMSATDKIKLDGIETGANNYSFEGLSNVSPSMVYSTTINTDGKWIAIIRSGVITNTHISASAAIATSKLADGSLFYKVDGSVSMQANVPMNGYKIVGMADPTSPQDGATKAYVDQFSSGLDVRAGARLATTTNITLSGVQTIDGETTATGDKILVKNQTDASENGTYLANDAGAWTRTADADQDGEIVKGMYVFISEGALNQKSGWILITPNPIVVGTTDLEFVQFTAAGQVSAGVGLDIDGSELFALSANPNNISISSSGIDIASNYPGQTSITTLGTIVTGVWNSSTPIAAAYGGTGLTSYDPGDIIYANGVSSLTTLSAVAVGNVLISGGVNTAPQWDKVGLTTHVSGVLPIGSGGTGQTNATDAFDALSPMTSLGDIIYGGASGTRTRLQGNTTTTKRFLSQTGNGSVSAAPSWISVTKADVGLSNVENTALSTWPGSSAIQTVGVINAVSAYWQANVIAIAYGGTGLSAAPSAGQVLIGTSSNTYALSSLSQGAGISISSGSGSITITNSGVTSVNGSSGAIINVAITGVTKLSEFATTTSAELATVINGKTGAGSLVFATSPTLTTPNIGVATATTVNNLTITNPGVSGATLTIASNTTFTTAGGNITLNTLTASNVILPSSGTLLSNSLGSARIWVGDSTGVAQARTMSGDATLSNLGVLTLKTFTGVAGTWNNNGTKVRPFSVDSNGRITSIGNEIDIAVTWDIITGTPTTLSGYSITDAYTVSQIDGFLSNKVSRSGDTMTGALDMQDNYIKNVGQLDFDDNLFFIPINHTTSGSTEETVYTLSLSSFRGFVFDYVLGNSVFSSVRTGQLMVSSDGSDVRKTEASTSDLGNTEAALLDVEINSGNLLLRVTAPSSGWKLRGHLRAM